MKRFLSQVRPGSAPNTEPRLSGAAMYFTFFEREISVGCSRVTRHHIKFNPGDILNDLWDIIRATAPVSGAASYLSRRLANFFEGLVRRVRPYIK